MQDAVRRHASIERFIVALFVAVQIRYFSSRLFHDDFYGRRIPRFVSAVYLRDKFSASHKRGAVCGAVKEYGIRLIFVPQMFCEIQ